jgi:hypothetical protein
MNKLKIIILICLAVLFLGMPVSAATDTTQANVEVKGGSLGLTLTDKRIDFDIITIDGKTQTLKKGLGIMNVFDFTGTGSGWNVTVGATPFSDGGDNLLPADCLMLMGIKVITADGTSSGLPTVYGTKPYTLGATQKIITAAEDYGMGKFNVDFDADALQLSVNSSALIAAQYTSTITYTITASP